MASDLKADTQKIAVTTTPKYADFGSPPLSEVYLLADGDNVQVDFDQSPDVSTSLPIPKNVVTRIRVNCNKVFALTSSSTANLYILGVRLNS
jgi:hypothetical protein